MWWRCIRLWWIVCPAAALLATDGVCMMLIDPHDDEAHYSLWNFTSESPVNDCYTRALFDAALYHRLGDSPIVVFGLGGGVLPARFSRESIPSIAVEWAQDIIDIYTETFIPMLTKWAPMRDVEVVRMDAFVYGRRHLRADTTVVIDIPQCYRDATDACGRMLQQLQQRRVRAIVNVWNTTSFAAKLNVQPLKVISNVRGMAVWVT